MTDRYLDTVPETHSRLSAVSSSLRELADLLDNFGPPRDLLRIMTVSNELKQIGWNTLFVSSSIEILIGSTIYEERHSGEKDEMTALRQIESLQVAVEYLVRSVRFMKTRNDGTDQAYPEINEAFQRLGDKLLEVAVECKRS